MWDEILKRGLTDEFLERLEEIMFTYGREYGSVFKEERWRALEVFELFNFATCGEVNEREYVFAPIHPKNVEVLARCLQGFCNGLGIPVKIREEFGILHVCMI